MKLKFFMIVLLAFISVAAQDKKEKGSDNSIITFVELGSDKCLPCIQMQPVLKAVKENYGDQIEVLFYDIWKSDQKKYASKYNIQLIPTQVFLNAKGKELFRHEGFLPEEEIDKFLQGKGLKKLNKKK